MDTSQELRVHWLSIRDELDDPDVKAVMAKMESDHRRSFRVIFGDPDLGMPLSGSAEADAEYARGLSLLEEGDTFGAEDAFWRADELGHAGAPRELFFLAGARGVDQSSGAATDLIGRARERGDGRAAAWIGRTRKDRPGRGLDELRFSDEAGDPEGSRELGLRLKESGELDQAESALRRADQRGSPSGSLALGLFLRDARHDLRGAEAAFRRAGERGHPKGPLNLIPLYSDRGDIEAATAASDETLKLAKMYSPIFPEMQKPEFVQYVRQVKGKTGAATGGGAAAASGSGCAMVSLLALIMGVVTVLASTRALRYATQIDGSRALAGPDDRQ